MSNEQDRLEAENFSRKVMEDMGPSGNHCHHGWIHDMKTAGHRYEEWFFDPECLRQRIAEALLAFSEERVRGERHDEK